mmetsp:Transcript_102338/g.330019  ORF Transcript_102338/g.330019 Transcript_102338/m.330019 type:complete len:203 (+) Transcript_102338:410-1018(+)
MRTAEARVGLGVEGAAAPERLPLLGSAFPGTVEVGELLPCEVCEPVLYESRIHKILDLLCSGSVRGLGEGVHECLQRSLILAQLLRFLAGKAVAASATTHPGEVPLNRQLRTRGPAAWCWRKDRARPACGAEEAAAEVQFTITAFASAPKVLCLVQVPTALWPGAEQPVLTEVGYADLVTGRDGAARTKCMIVASVVPEGIG